MDTTYTHPAKLWLVKLDSMGCLVLGCHMVGIEEQALDLNQYLHIWPNPLPAGQPLQFTFEPPAALASNGPLRVVLLDAQGRQVHEQRVEHGADQLASLTLAAGLYYLYLTDGTRWLAGRGGSGGVCAVALAQVRWSRSRSGAVLRGCCR